MVAILGRSFYSCSQHLSRATAKLSELGHRREAVKILLKLAAIKRTFAEDGITPEERQDNLLEVPRVRRHATDKDTHAPASYLPICKHRSFNTPALLLNVSANVSTQANECLGSAHHECLSRFSYKLIFKPHFLSTGVWYPERSCEFIWCCTAWCPVCFYSLRGVLFVFIDSKTQIISIFWGECNFSKATQNKSTLRLEMHLVRIN